MLFFLNITCCGSSHQEGCRFYSLGPGSVLGKPWQLWVQEKSCFSLRKKCLISEVRLRRHWKLDIMDKNGLQNCHPGKQATWQHFCLFLLLCLFSTGEHSHGPGFSSSLELCRCRVDKKDVPRDSADKSGKWVKVQLWMNSSFERHFWLWTADVVSRSEVGEELASHSLAAEDQKQRAAFHDPIKMHHHNLGVVTRPRTDDSTSSAALMHRVTAKKKSWTLKDRRLFNGSGT